jgi:hypothetical protein
MIGCRASEDVRPRARDADTIAGLGLLSSLANSEKVDLKRYRPLFSGNQAAGKRKGSKLMGAASSGQAITVVRYPRPRQRRCRRFLPAAVEARCSCDEAGHRARIANIFIRRRVREVGRAST